ncbi:MAG: RpsK protein [Candidatus Shapirobacteria bacterium GW2011_GWE1_38_10]|uniref:Small ribosomal subunit protein uS11 n=1 Tax=Candidatus Shapirobacteria bacterium GW2011_GWE1_38_10 TaxID=1618488 RepID=A0A0G0I6K4_9BACT|nr:MAG: RpsK protein [Candidatus Shapirobacteria bacterium GW2011_GWF2_37_20]KKQ50162.1 MAG: RpsK protein [Candidatus Shapirobacteria bacterium GW2011_GWE1_38_10]KKQ64756.1 MAG: RpsK protein [Candidatus Shapirobacteria bacterium GW2011_GWF1_38_23]HBP50914.1 30S ribosomal protein S11 [Candidatus Shapirobacteria bacterium]
MDTTSKTTTPVVSAKSGSTSGVKKVAKKVIKSIAEGRLYIQSSFNNTIVTITDANGNTLAWSSSGQCGFKGSRKSTPYAATTAIEKALDGVRQYGIKKLAVYLKGPGTGRDAALRYLRTKRDFEVDLIADVTPVPHNGPRPPKARRV